MSAPTIVIPMAGSGQRFRDAGFTVAKPLIDVRGRPMIAHVLDNMPLAGARVILIARREDAQAHPEAFAALEARYGCEFLLTDRLTEGAACTILHAAAQINHDAPLLIANADQVVDHDLAAFVRDGQARGLDGSILTFPEPARHPKWSYAAVSDAGLVTETREKSPISTQATVGIYWFARGRYFVEAAAAMIAANDRCNGEFYVCPCYNYLIRRQMKIGVHEIAREAMHGLGTPEDLQAFLAAAG